MIVQVNSDGAIEGWPTLAPLFARVLESTQGCYETSDILREIISGEQALFVAIDQEANRVDAVMTAAIATFPRRRVCKVVFVAGDNMDRWLPEFIEVVETFARANGATGLSGAYRRGWVKVWPGLRETGATLFKDLVE